MPSIQSLHEPSVRTWVDRETYTPQKQNQDDRNLRIGITDLNSAIADLENHYAGGSQPLSKVQGKLWYDSTNGVEKVFHTANGTPVALLDSAKMYSTSIPTSGTATLKVGGNIDVNTTQSSVGTGDFTTSTLPGSTLGTDGALATFVGFGTADTPGGAFSSSLNGEIGGNGLFGILAGNFSADTEPMSDWFGKIVAVRTAAGTMKYGIMIKGNRDDTPRNPHVKSGSVSVTLSSDVAFGFSHARNSGTPSATQEIGILRIAP